MRRLVNLRLRVNEDGSVAAEVSARLSREAYLARGKTHMCRNFERGMCYRGAMCSYAHMFSELTPEAQKEYQERQEERMQYNSAILPYGREPQRLDDLYGNYKTVLCEEFKADGTCSRGDSCSFAHGEGELRSKRRGLSERDLFQAEKARTRMCRNWLLNGTCPNGAACLYAHGEEVLAKRQAALTLVDEKAEEDLVGDASNDGLTCLCLKPYSGCRLWPIASHGVSQSHTIRPGPVVWCRRLH